MKEKKQIKKNKKSGVVRTFIKNHKLSLFALLIGGFLIYIWQKGSEEDKETDISIPQIPSAVKPIENQRQNNVTLTFEPETDDRRFNVPEKIKKAESTDKQQRMSFRNIPIEQNTSERIIFPRPSAARSVPKPISKPVPPKYKTIHHDAIGHYKTQLIPAFDEPLYQAKIVGSSTGKIYKNMQEFRNQDIDSAYRIEYVQRGTMHHDETTKQVWVIDKEAWDEVIPQDKPAVTKEELPKPNFFIECDTEKTQIMEKIDEHQIDLLNHFKMNGQEKKSELILSVEVNGKKNTHVIDKFPCLIGRDGQFCDLVIREVTVSHKHAKISEGTKCLYLTSVSEHNGTYINGIKLPTAGKACINVGDCIGLGTAKIKVEQIILK